MKKFTPQEIAVLKQQKYIIFTEFELELLAKGEAPLKVEHNAEKSLDKFRAHLQMPMSRGESMITFLTKQEFHQSIGRLNDQLLFLTKALIKKNILTEAEITLTAHEMIAEQWSHLCDNCVHDFAVCGVNAEGVSTEQKQFKPKFSKEIFPDLTGALADKVIKCEKYEKKVEEMKAENVEKKET